MAAVAHVSYPGGGVFLPDHGPGDRHTIMEYVERLVSSKRQVQILLDNHRWLVQSSEHACCAVCDLATKAACREANEGGELYCLRCALSAARAEERARATPRHLTLAFVQT
jgi:hypothetical protein